MRSLVFGVLARMGSNIESCSFESRDRITRVKAKRGTITVAAAIPGMVNEGYWLLYNSIKLVASNVIMKVTKLKPNRFEAELAGGVPTIPRQWRLLSKSACRAPSSALGLDFVCYVPSGAS